MSERPSFIAIDVETANNEPSSICSIAAVKVVEQILDGSLFAVSAIKQDFHYF